jgi:hypothetical protein
LQLRDENGQGRPNRAPLHPVQTQFSHVCLCCPEVDRDVVYGDSDSIGNVRPAKRLVELSERGSELGWSERYLGMVDASGRQSDVLELPAECCHPMPIGFIEALALDRPYDRGESLMPRRQGGAGAGADGTTD